MTGHSRKPSDRRRAGNTMIEFVLVGLPMVLVLVVTFEMARAMWLYHTAAYAASEAVRYAIVHGNYCVQPPSNCAKTLADIAGVIKYAGIGLDAKELMVTFGGTKAAVYGPDTLEHFLGMKTVYWPVSSDGTKTAPGGDDAEELSIRLSYGFTGAVPALLSMIPPAGTVPKLNLPATAQEKIQF